MDYRLGKLQRTLAEAIAGMSEAELNWHPPGKWCAAEILEHLYLTYTGTVKGFEKIEQQGHPLATAATWGNRWRAWVVTGFGYLPEGRKAPVHTQPKGVPKEKVVNGFSAKIGELDEKIAACEERFGDRVKLLDHPFLGPLTGTEWRKFHLVHGLHHAKQIRGLRAQMQKSA